MGNFMKNRTFNEYKKKCYVYKALGVHYKYSTKVYAFNVSDARKLGLRQARMVFGTSGRILRDLVELAE